MRAWAPHACAAAALLCAAVWAAGRQSAAPSAGAPQAEQSSVISVNVFRVSLLFTVTDKKGRFITDLGRDDFEIVENKKPQTILEFAAESNLPLRLGILIDTSNSIRERFRFEQEAATQFVQTVLSKNVDKALVVSFDTQAQLASDLVGDPLQIENAIRGLHPGGGTALYDAIYFACRDKLGQDQPKDKFRRAIVILSDGDDNQSAYSRDQALERAQKDDVVLYSISTNISRLETDGDKVLKYYAEETGGRAYFPFKVEDLEQSFENIANELRHQYSIAYRPEPLTTDGLFHPIQVRVKDRKDLVVNVRKGYYPPKM